jgi:peptide-methionine (S)-S-oxide reductase
LIYLFNYIKLKLIKTIYLAGGCFWCTEAVFKEIKGVVEVIPGYIDGTIKNPAYREVCTGRTGHTEAISVRYDTTQVQLTDLLLIFFNTHDPTTLNRQGNDIGTQYRSGIYYTEDEQKGIAQFVIDQLETEAVFDQKIVTEIKEATPFYEAEAEHHDYYNQNKEQPYCVYSIHPKMEKLKHYFSNYLNTAYER